MSFAEYLRAQRIRIVPGRDARPWVIAHRGYSGAAPENTLAAVDAARAIGSDLIEVDLGISGDGTPMVLHDSTLNRTTSASGTIAQMSDERISLADAGSWLGPGFAGQRVPRLRNVLADLAEHGGTLLLELKDDWSPGAVSQVAEDIIETGTADRIILQSFSVTTLEALRDLIPMVPRCLLRLVPRDGDVELAHALEVIAYNPSQRGFFGRRQLAEEFMELGFGMFVWTVDEPAVWERLLGSGVSGIITNHPGRLQGYLAAKYDAV
ncbi:glycerophosphodiester phosphodiesterase [Brevibacterium ihuae]|uniref:glycerophosphodiester phosphodiesterase n=1 Tax=Brevibacterium ihuae TaxID=1631743 RepID=UPI000C764097|nr:glycerophosphodiester phosphodiesterase family protein [Brevibacterium ihuae]